MDAMDVMDSKPMNRAGETPARPGGVCYLRRTEVVLADGRAWSFRALPMSRRTMPLLLAILDEETGTAAKLEAMVKAIEISLGYDQSAEEIEAAFESGLITPNDERILAALGAGLTGGGEG